MLLAVVLVVAGVVVLSGLVAWTSARARRCGRARAEVATALGARAGALAAPRRSVNGGRTADGSEPIALPAR